MKNDNETPWIHSGDWMKRTRATLAANAGKAVAAITAVVACLVAFTDVGIAQAGLRTFTLTLGLMLAASYIIFFSMEDAGEKAGEECESYRRACADYRAAVEKVTGEDIGPLRAFCERYAEEELIYRRRRLLTLGGYTEEEYQRFLTEGTLPVSKKGQHSARRVFAQAARQKPATLTPAVLLTDLPGREDEQLRDPETTRIPRLMLRLLPSTLCTLLTVSVVLSAKSDLSAAAVIENLLKLAGLPILGCRGYVRGFHYVREQRTVWLETRTRLLRAFLREEAAGTGTCPATDGDAPFPAGAAQG